MSKLPWFKFFPTDWRADVGLKLCSLAARGLWLEMICIMHEAGGYLEINGSNVTTLALASLSGSTPQEITALLGELEEAGVFSRDRKGRLYSRRMLRDLKKSSVARNNGRKGGNPSLVTGRTPIGEGVASMSGPSASSKRKKRAKLKPDPGEGHKVPLNGEDKPQSPEARDQTLPLTPKGVKSPHDPDQDREKALAEQKLEETGSSDARSHANQQQTNRRGSRLDTDWVPDERDQDFARNRGLEEEDIATEALKFRNYWTSLGGRRACKIDWHRTWQNWILRIHFGNNSAKGHPAQGYPGKGNLAGNKTIGGQSTGRGYSSRAAGCGQRSGGFDLGEIGARVLGRAEIQDDLSQGRGYSEQAGGRDLSQVYDDGAAE
ncbi:helix-turn-helix domain-containing protein [Kiloniella spongiae]|uniref:helix-turn-helix domain-containing protein n=1 Tax=Kiloniella spongiae TaxID=1489064 RepID=UPI000699C1B8|nr:helix-turn-helix domain-containing protein [Kiloniella spongiae]